MTRNDAIALLAAATMINDDPTLADYDALDRFDRARLIRDYRDDFASSPFPLLADAKIGDDMIHMIMLRLDSLI